MQQVTLIAMDMKVSVEMFEGLRPGPTSREGGERVEAILASYFCFSRPCIQSSTSRHTRQQPYHQSSTRTRVVEPRQMLSCVDVSKSTLVALLNKVNEGNYARMLELIMHNVKTSSQPMEGCMALLRKCYEQDFYTHVYIRLLSDVVLELNATDRVLVDEGLAEFVEGTMLIADIVPTSDTGVALVSQYDITCRQLKRKRIAIGRARTSIGLIDLGLVMTEREDFFRECVATIRVFCRVPDYQDDVIDVAIEYVREFMCCVRERTHPRITELRNVLNSHVEGTSSLMCKFKLQAIVNLQLHPSPDPIQDHPQETEIWQTTSKLRQHLRSPSYRAQETHSGGPNRRRTTARNAPCLEAARTRPGGDCANQTRMRPAARTPAGG